jgi:hypothetical protein
MKCTSVWKNGDLEFDHCYLLLSRFFFPLRISFFVCCREPYSFGQGSLIGCNKRRKIFMCLIQDWESKFHLGYNTFALVCFNYEVVHQEALNGSFLVKKSKTRMIMMTLLYWLLFVLN